jgi:hypothetical protein
LSIEKYLKASQVIDTLGIPFAAPLALAPVAGFMKDKKNIL